MIHPSIVDGASLHRPEIPVEDLWPLLVRAQVVESVDWLSGWLWRYRVASFVSSLSGHCLSCGSLLDSTVARRSFCSDACRAQAFRDRRVIGGSRLELAIRSAQADLDQIMSQLDEYRVWYRSLPFHFQVVPPDLLRVQHLPKLPGRCGRGCSGTVGCAHTEGAACLFAGTGGDDGS
jgi:hypothetical protein